MNHMPRSLMRRRLLAATLSVVLVAQPALAIGPTPTLPADLNSLYKKFFELVQGYVTSYLSFLFPNNAPTLQPKILGVSDPNTLTQEAGGNFSPYRARDVRRSLLGGVSAGILSEQGQQMLTDEITQADSELKSVEQQVQDSDQAVQTALSNSADQSTRAVMQNVAQILGDTNHILMENAKMTARLDRDLVRMQGAMAIQSTALRDIGVQLDESNYYAKIERHSAAAAGLRGAAQSFVPF